MTERRRVSQRPAYAVYGGAAVAFAGVLGGLAWQVAGGADPAIGGGEPAASAAPVERVIVRRIVVERDAPAERQAPAPEPAPPAPVPTTRAS
jgi:hypothetical protein